MEHERRFGNRFGDRESNGGHMDRGSRGFSRPFQPVKEGEELSTVIEAVAEKGDGIAKKSGFVIFVPGTKVGDKVKIRIKKVAKKVAFAEVVGSYEESSVEQESTQEKVEEVQAEPEENYDASQDSEEF